MAITAATNDPLLQRILQFLQTLTPEESAALQALTQTREIRAGAFLLRSGQVCSDSFYLVSGVARKFTATSEKELTTEFFFAGDLAVSFASYTLQTPSKESIQALSDCTVQVTSHAGFEGAKRAFPKLLQLDLLMTEQYAAWLEERLLQLRTLDATQRYQRLLQQEPHIIQHVQLTHIASYLNVSLETLSRIRAKIGG